MLPTSKSMDYATDDILRTFVFYIKGCTTEATYNPEIGALCSYIVVQAVQEAICALNMKINTSYLWTDSSIVLTWIQGPPTRWKTYVGNRVAIIQEERDSATWRHVPSQSNPADLISRVVKLQLF